tara:strand:+ start:2862 stop:3437 length:576 start_codon:yes stop_codon:yes gene_type:complete
MEKKRQQNKSKPEESNYDEDIGLWRQVVADVIPLEKKSAVQNATGAKSDRKLQMGSKTSCLSPESECVQVKTQLVPLSHGMLVGLDKRTGERLKRGKLPVEGHLDMHGMSQSRAYSALNTFILDKQAAGKRCVIVITGKGGRDGGVGVLKEAVPRWLNEPSLRKHVLGFDYASPRLGGTGALYILLKRKRF